MSVALVIQRAERMRPIVICGLSGCTNFFSNYAYLIKERFSKKNYWAQNVCFDFLYNFYLKTFLILRTTQRDAVTNVHRSSPDVPSILLIFYTNFKYLHVVSKGIRISDFMKILQVGAEERWRDGMT